MKQNIIKMLRVVSLSLIIPGCGKVIDWAKDSVNQGIDLPVEVAAARRMIRSIRPYSQFTLLGSFDALPLTDHVRSTYVELTTQKYAVDPSHKAAALRRQLEENNHFISFFVLTLVDMPLHKDTSTWSIFLQVDNVSFDPIEVKEVELGLEYQEIFGKKYSRFKRAYKVVFSAQDVEDKSILMPDSKKLALTFRSVKKEVQLVWDLKDGKIQERAS